MAVNDYRLNKLIENETEAVVGTIETDLEGAERVVLMLTTLVGRDGDAILTEHGNISRKKMVADPAPAKEKRKEDAGSRTFFVCEWPLPVGDAYGNATIEKADSPSSAIAIMNRPGQKFVILLKSSAEPPCSNEELKRRYGVEDD